MSHECRGISKSPENWLFIQQLVWANIKVLYYWPFVRGIHQSPVVPLTKYSPVIQKVFSWYDIIMIFANFFHYHIYHRSGHFGGVVMNWQMYKANRWGKWKLKCLSIHHDTEIFLIWTKSDVFLFLCKCYNGISFTAAKTAIDGIANYNDKKFVILKLF